MHNTFRTTALTIALPLFLAVSGPAQAVHYSEVDPADSTIQFHYRQMGVDMEGSFTAFNAVLDVDTDDPTAGSARFEVDLSSVDTGTADGDTEVLTRDWFHVDEHPVASFESTGIHVVSENDYEVTGTFTLKGHSTDIRIPVRHTSAGERGLFEGTFTLKRGDFNIGEGSWSSFDIVANEVDVHVRISAIAR